MPEPNEQRPRLADQCAEVFAFAFQLRASKDPGAAADVKQKVAGIFSEFETRARSAGFKPETIQTAKYAMVAFIDETILASKFPMKDEWAGSPLQLEYFNDFAAGEEFYNKLKQVREGAGPEKRDLLEVYFLCLTHGFKGMYIDLKGMEERKQLLNALAAEIREGAGGNPVQISPSLQPPDELPAVARSLPSWLIPAICAVLLIAVLVVLAATAEIMAGGAASTLTETES
jgi:type VI secretion system protein ImpK